MKKRQQLPNLIKGIQRLIGHIKNDNEKYSDLKFKDHSDIFYKEIFNEDGRVTITHENQKEFLRLIENIKVVFDNENLNYDIEQIEERLSKFVLQTIEKFLSCETERIKAFVESLKVPEYVEYFFRLSDFDYKCRTNFGDHIKIIKGKEILSKIPVKMNRSVDNNSKYKNIINSDDILLGISVIAPEEGYQGYYKALDTATRVNNLINFLNGFDHKASKVLELNTYIIHENNLYQFKNKNENFYVKQTPGILDSNWNILNKRHPDNRENSNLDFDNRWLKKIPSIIENDEKLSALQKQCARAIDWIGDGMVNSNLTKQFLQIMISLETMIEQNPDELESKLKKEKLYNENLSLSIDSQLVSIINLICYKEVEKSQLEQKDKRIKHAYELRSRITHDGAQLSENEETLISYWYDIVYKIVSNIVFDNRWDNIYDLWKEANLKKVIINN